MKSLSFFRYPGGKSKLRDIIIKRLEQINQEGLQYREPFFGGGSIGLKLLADNPAITKIWMNDKDIGIACLWTSIIQFAVEFKDRVQSFSPSIDAFFSIREELTHLTEIPTQSDRIIDIGFKKLAIHQISYSGLGTKSGGPLGGIEQKSNYKIDCRWSPDYICKKVDKLHNWFSSIEISSLLLCK